MPSEAVASQQPSPTAPPAPTERPTPTPHPTAGSFAESLVAGLRTLTDVSFTSPLPCGRAECSVPLDILAPEAGEALPTIVLVHGEPVPFHERRYFEDMAAAVATRGAVVFLPTYRSSVTGGRAADKAIDVRCAVRYARSVTPDYGGDPNRLVLVGHSLGSDIVLEIAVSPESETPGCLADESGVPNAVVGLAGFSLDLSDAADSGPPILLVSGSEDSQAGSGPGTAERLVEAGFEAQYFELEGIDHFEIVEPEVAPEVIDFIFQAAESLVP